MSEQEPKTLPPLAERIRTGEQFQLADPTELAVFEDLVAQEYLNNRFAEMHSENFCFRKPLLNLIRPVGCNGSFENIFLRPMPAAYDRLFDVNKRGKKYLPDTGLPRKRPVHAQEAEQKTQGFTLTADIRRSGKVKETLSTEIFFVPLPYVDTKTRERVITNTGGVVNRYLTKPEIKPIEIEVLDKPGFDSREIGSVALKESGMGKPTQ